MVCLSNQSSAVGRRAAVPARAFCLALVFLFTAVPAVADSLVVYGGVGHVKGAWQPETHKILTAGSGRLGDLRRSLGMAMEARVQEIRFAWSDDPVAVTSEDVVRAIRARDPAFDNQSPDMSDMLDHFDTVYALVVIPTYESGFVVSGGRSDIAVDNWFFLVWTSAVLVELGSREVKLAATALVEEKISVDGGTTAVGDLPARIKDLIEQSGREALDALSRVSSKRQPADDFPMMFTGAIVSDSAARSLFAFEKPDKAKRGNVCTLPSECRNEDCGRLISLVANSVAENLTKAGIPVLPPINLNAWGQRAEDRVALNLSLPRGARHFEEQFAIVVGADSADVKLVPVISGLRFADRAGATKYTKTRHYLAQARVLGFETDPDDCATVIEDYATEKSTIDHAETIVAGRTDRSALDRARLLAMLSDAFSGLDLDALK